MSEHLLKRWQEDKIALKRAKEWNDLPNGRKYNEDQSFEISKAHCRPPILVRIGQQSHGGQNYWNTEEEFDQMILNYLDDDWDNHYPKIIKMMEEKERESLQECKTYINEMLNKIEDASNV